MNGGDRLNVVRDMVQSRLLGAIFTNSLRGELVLKGGFAMRVMANSHRFTKDIDLAASPAIPLRVVQNCIRKAIAEIKGVGLLQNLSVSEPKQTDTTQRWKIGGRVGDHDLNLTIEVSRRNTVDQDLNNTSYETPGAGYGPVPIACIGLPSLASAKLDCLANPRREAPRDIYDLYLLIKMDVRPTPEAIASYGEEKLAEIRDMIWHKLEKMDYETCRTQLAGFLPSEVAVKLTPEVWDEMRLTVGTEIVNWVEGHIGKDPAGNKGEDNERMAGISL